MRRIVVWLFVLVVIVVPSSRADVPVSLKGSPDSMVRQNRIAEEEGLLFVETTEELQDLVEEGTLVPLTGNENYTLREGVSFDVARAEMRLFIERLAAQYREGTGEKLVVTSLTRPVSRQPGNSHPLSVHPAGVAVDLRVSKRAASRQWLESVLLSLERKGLLDVTREKWPPHYHVALFPEVYTAHVEAMIGPEALQAALQGETPEQNAAAQKVSLEAAPASATKIPLVLASTPIDEAASEAKEWGWLAAVSLILITVSLLRRRGKEILLRWYSRG